MATPNFESPATRTAHDGTGHTDLGWLDARACGFRNRRSKAMIALRNARRASSHWEKPSPEDRIVRSSRPARVKGCVYTRQRPEIAGSGNRPLPTLEHY